MRFLPLFAILVSSVALLGCGAVGQRVIDAYAVPPPHDGTFTANTASRDTAQLPDGGGGGN